MAIKAVHLSKSFGSPAVKVLHDLSFQIESGEFVALTGRSGSGKSTLLYLLGALDFPTEGHVELGGHNLSTISERELHRIRNQSVGFVFQFHYLLPELTALENVLTPVRKAADFGGAVAEFETRAQELLVRFGLEGKEHRLPRHLSGGEQQRVAIARALVMRPKYLFADEPTGALDSVNGETVIRLFEETNRIDGTTVIMVTHDTGFAARARRQIRLVDGRIAEDLVNSASPSV